MGRFADGGRKWKVFLYVKIWKMCFWNVLFMSTWWPEIPRPGNNHVIECAMKGWCEWFRDMPVVTWPNIYTGLPTISKWTSLIADVFSWYLCGIYLWSCVCKKGQELKLENVIIKVSYQLIHRRKVHRRYSIPEMSHSEVFLPEFTQTYPKNFTPKNDWDIFSKPHKKRLHVYFKEEKSNSEIFRQSVSFITQ